MQKSKSDRKHEVRAQLSNVELVKAKSSLKLSVYARKEKIGEVQIGRGFLYWWGHKRKLPKRVSWSKFAAMIHKRTRNFPNSTIFQNAVREMVDTRRYLGGMPER
jgi:hypothetical protein